MCFYKIVYIVAHAIMLMYYINISVVPLLCKDPSCQTEHSTSNALVV